MRAIGDRTPFRGPVPYNSIGTINQNDSLSPAAIIPLNTILFFRTACNVHIKVCLIWCHYWVLSRYKQNADQRENIVEP